MTIAVIYNLTTKLILMPNTSIIFNIHGKMYINFNNITKLDHAVT